MIKVKVTRKITIAFAVFSMITGMASLSPAPKGSDPGIDKYYLLQLDLFKKSIISLKGASQKKEPLISLKQRFFQTRLVYKKLAVLTEYFNPYETKSLNGPALERIESEIGDRIIPAQGLQAVELLLFSDWQSAAAYPKLNAMLDGMLTVIGKMEKEPDLQYKFNEMLLWDAVRASILQVVTVGITGFDSPVANYSITEAASTLDGIQALVSLFKEELDKKTPGRYLQLTALLKKAKEPLKKNTAFNSFDRLNFITDYINPLYKYLVETRILAGIAVPEGNNAINFNTTSLFAADAMNINFFSPPQEYWMTPERVFLGKKLFSDPLLSGTGTRSCASCHKPEQAFTDGVSKPYSIDNTVLLTRNTPTLWNSGYQTKQFMDSRADILENQLGEVVHNASEMKGSLKQSVADLKASPQYNALFKKAYSAEKEPITTFTIANAISSYVRSLQSLNAPFDQYMRGDKTKMSAGEKRGFNLFAGKAKCATCHFIPLFNGLVPPFFAETESEVLGVPASKDKKNPQLDTDLGKYFFTQSVIHKYAFKTPSLRNVALTAPYMHNGVYDNLEEVMEFYNNGGGKGLNIAPPNQTLPFDKLGLTEKESKDIISFMKALTDTIPAARH